MRMCREEGIVFQQQVVHCSKIMVPVEVVSNVATQNAHSRSSILCIADADVWQLLVVMTFCHLASIKIALVVVFLASPKDSSIKLRDESDFSVHRRDVALECQADILAVVLA